MSLRPTNSHTTSGVPLDLVQVVAVLLRTGWAWVARTRLGFIPNGDAPPIHDTPTEPSIDWTSTPSRPLIHTFAPATDETVTLGGIDPPTESRTATANPTSRRFIFEQPAKHYPVPWSVLLAVAGVALVYLTTVAVGLTGSLVASVAVGSIVVCGLLLVVAQLIGEPKR